jgi:hypothetical protein
MRFTSPTQVSESRSVAARSLLLGFSMAYSTRSQLNTQFAHLLAQAVEHLCSDLASSKALGCLPRWPIGAEEGRDSLVLTLFWSCFRLTLL